MTNPSDARLLVIETTGRQGQVAVAVGEQLRGRRLLDRARRHARDLAPAVRELLHEQGWRPKDISAVMVSRGPGSYTGLRVAIISAKVFAYATGCRLLAIDTLAAIALQAPAGRLTVLVDAQQGNVYAQQFLLRPGAGLPEATSDLTIVPFLQLVDQLHAGLFVTGPGLREFRNQLPAGVPIVAEEHWEPRPESLLRIGLERLARDERDDFWALEPLYLRPSPAEEKWDKLGK